jgi:hypothetical protein
MHVTVTGSAVALAKGSLEIRRKRHEIWSIRDIGTPWRDRKSRKMRETPSVMERPIYWGQVSQFDRRF